MKNVQGHISSHCKPNKASYPRFICNTGNDSKWHYRKFQQYTSITRKTNFKYFSVFANKDKNPYLPGSNWDFNFSEQNGITKVSINIYNKSEKRLQKMIEMGVKEGFMMTLNELANLLSTLKK